MKAIALMCAVGMFAASEQQAPQRDAPVAAVTGTAAIRGVVVSDDAAQRPLRRVRVALTGVPGGRVAMTDDDGRFVFVTLPAGNYTLAASRPAYLPVAYGATRPGRSGTTIVLAEKQSTDIKITMALGGVVAGTVRDGRGRPMPAIDVGLVPLPTGENSRPAFSPQPVTTDDRGEYRLYGVPPGQYFVAAVAQNNAPAGGTGRRSVEENDALLSQLQLRGGDAAALMPVAPARKLEPLPAAPAVSLAPMFYPGTARVESAVVVSVAAGVERVGIDIAIVPVRSMSIDGTVQGPVQKLDRVELSLVINGPQFPSFTGSRPVLSRPPDAQASDRRCRSLTGNA